MKRVLYIGGHRDCDSSRIMIEIIRKYSDINKTLLIDSDLTRDCNSDFLSAYDVVLMDMADAAFEDNSFKSMDMLLQIARSARNLNIRTAMLNIADIPGDCVWELFDYVSVIENSDWNCLKNGTSEIHEIPDVRMLSFDQAIHHTVDKQDQLTSIQQIELSVYNAIHGLNVMDEVPKTGQGLQLFRSVVKRIRKFTLPRNRRHITRYPLHFFQDIPGISTCRTIRWHRKTFGFVNHIGVLRKKCAGDAFIIASGPSMKHCDISAMNMKHCFALNGSVMKFVEQNRSPGYYVVIDVDVVWNRLDMIRHAVNRGARCFFTTRVIRAICEADQTLLQRADIYLLDPVNWTYDGRHLSIEAFKNNALNDHDFQLDATGVYDPTVVGFSKNLEKGVFPGATVVFPAIQIAYYMGYRRVFILGMDLGAKAGQIRFYDELGQARPSHLTDDYDQAIYPSMMLLKEIQDLDLYNVSLNSRLPDHCMPRISFEDMQAMMQHQQDDCGLANDIS